MSTIPEPIPSWVQPASHVSRCTLFTGGLLSVGALVAIRGGALAQTAPAPTEKPNPKFQQRPDEWRNRQPVIAYRRLGRTGFMVSEIVLGGSGPLNTPQRAIEHMEAIERGVNYLDSSTRYGQKGASEER